MLIVDDLVDTGQTARVVRDLLPAAHFATVYAKPMGRPLVDTFITEVSQDTWIYFPWDTGLAFSRRSAKVATDKISGGAMLTRRHLLASAGAAAVCAVSPQADAQSKYASQPVHILVGYPAGGGVDIIARLLAGPDEGGARPAHHCRKSRGCECDAGDRSRRESRPDGYTLLACASGEVAINHFLFKEKMAYDPAKELAAIALVGIVPCVVVVESATPVNNPKELIAYIKENPGKLSFSSSGIGNPAAACGRIDEHDGRHQGIARALSRRRAGGHGCCNWSRHDEFYEPGRCAAIDAGG